MEITLWTWSAKLSKSNETWLHWSHRETSGDSSLWISQKECREVKGWTACWECHRQNCHFCRHQFWASKTPHKTCRMPLWLCYISDVLLTRWKDTSSPLQGKIHGVNLTNWVFSKQTPPSEPDLPGAPWASFQKLSRESLLCCCLPRHDDLQEIFSRHHMVPWVFLVVARCLAKCIIAKLLDTKDNCFSHPFLNSSC